MKRHGSRCGICRIYDEELPNVNVLVGLDQFRAVSVLHCLHHLCEQDEFMVPMSTLPA